MNLHTLRIFTKVAELKSVSKAADALRISQPAVTIQVRNLEKEVGFSLIESKGRGITLTHKGEFLYQQSQRLFDLENDIEHKIAQVRDSGTEDLNIAASYIPANFLLPKWLSKYKTAFPKRKVNVKTENTLQVIEQLLHYKADLAFVIEENDHHPDIDYQFLLNLEFCFIAPYNHRLAGKTVSYETLMHEPFILREEGSSTKDLLLALCKLHKAPPPNIGMQLYGLSVSIQTVAAGYGIMLAPSIALDNFIRQKQVAKVHVKGIDIQRPVYLCTRKSEMNVQPHVGDFIQKINGTIQ